MIANASVGIPRDASVAGTGGRLGAIKNIPLFLESGALARQQGVDVRPVIVGGGELRAELEARARELGLAEGAGFAGGVSMEDSIVRPSVALVVATLGRAIAAALGTPRTP